MAVTDRYYLAWSLGLALAALLWPQPVTAQVAPRRLSSAVLVYQDDNAVTVISPRLAGHQQLGQTRLEAAVGVDLVTAASVDLVTAASPKGFSEERWHADGSAQPRQPGGNGYDDGRLRAGGPALRRQPARLEAGLPDLVHHR